VCAISRSSFCFTRTAIEHASEINSFEYYHKLGALVSPQLKMHNTLTISVDKQEVAGSEISYSSCAYRGASSSGTLARALKKSVILFFRLSKRCASLKRSALFCRYCLPQGQAMKRLSPSSKNAVNNERSEIAKGLFCRRVSISARRQRCFTLAHLVICNDAAPRHVAAAIGKKSLTLMPTPPQAQLAGLWRKQKAYFLFSDVPSESRAVDTVEPAELAGMIRKL
jgi:hypothetical protein